MKKKLFIKFLSILTILMVVIGVLPSNDIAYGSSSSILDDDGNEMYTVPVTLYDYKSDSEIDLGYIDNYHNGTGQYMGYNHYGFESFNKKISNYFKSNSMNYPMYFGDFNIDDTFSKKGNSLYNAYWAVNRANTNDMSAAVQGLVDRELKDGVITQNSVELPYFNEGFLTNTTPNNKPIGEVVDTRFPFRKTVYKGIEYYEFDSEKGKDNVWLEDNQLNYSSDESTHGVWDACHTMVKSSELDGIGFFPFNNRVKDGSDSERSKLNFGFGLRMDIKFNVPENGILMDSNGDAQDVSFQFTGDDDVWVFIDGKLVLDIGGDHKKSIGTINFNSSKLYSKVSKVVDGSLKGGVSQSVKNGSKISLSELGLDFSDPTEEHTLTLYYMERGMIESNMKIRYNFNNNNIIDVAKEVDNSAVNEGLKSTVDNLIANDEYNFSLNSVDDDNKEFPVSNSKYTIDGNENVTGNNGDFTLRGGEDAIFMNSISSYSNFRVEENIDEDFANKYSTTVTINNESGTKVISGTDSGKINLSRENSLLSKASVLFTNKINTGNLLITKEVDDYVKNRFENYENDEFTFQVQMKNLFGKNDSELKTYDFVYTVDGGEKQVAKDGKITLKVGQVAKIEGIPVDTICLINETRYPDRYTLKSANNSYISITQEDITATFTNGAANEVYDLVLKKTIDDKYYKSDDEYSCNETYAGLTDVEQSFIFTIKQYNLPEDDPSRKLINEFQEVISFNNKDGLSKEKVIKNLPKGYYEVVEDTEWCWKYEFKKVSVNERGASKYSFAKASNIDLGYSIKETPTVEFVNNIKYLDKNHNDVPEGDTAIEKNILKK